MEFIERNKSVEEVKIFELSNEDEEEDHHHGWESFKYKFLPPKPQINYGLKEMCTKEIDIGINLQHIRVKICHIFLFFKAYLILIKEGENHWYKDYLINHVGTTD